MDLADFSEALRPYWGVWLLMLFSGVCPWAFWPTTKRQQEVDDAAAIPLRDDD
jgi:cytochrome c oxidase cbb3-type subunit 4